MSYDPDELPVVTKAAETAQEWAEGGHTVFTVMQGTGHYPPEVNLCRSKIGFCVVSCTFPEVGRLAGARWSGRCAGWRAECRCWPTTSAPRLRPR
jgi:hypothetical protein